MPPETAQLSKDDTCEGSNPLVHIHGKPHFTLIQGGLGKPEIPPETQIASTTKAMTWEEDMAARQQAVRWALEEHGTTNTDFLGLNKQIGTHTERPMAFTGESITSEHQAISPTGSVMRPSTPDELQSLDTWVRNFPQSLRESTEKAYALLRSETRKK